MRRTLWLALFAAVASVGALVALLRPAPLPAEAGPAEASLVKAPSPSSPQLPITGCALFSSGVGFFQREGEIDGNARVDLTFPVGDINDLLKSMVLEDRGNGRIDAVSYDSHDPIDKTLKSFAVNLTKNPGFGDILDQARGEKVEVIQQQAANQPGTLTGTVVGVEIKKQQAGKDAAVEVEMLNLWCADGLRSVKLAEVQRIRFLNPVMESELRRALEVLALSHDTQKKAVSLSFSGEGKRPVRVGYVVENPIWKTSYRLVLNKEGQPYLQGWAVVENPTDEDWKDVRMALVSGRPISFQMDLYQPLYVGRPTVVPELFASLQPKTYESQLEGSFSADLNHPSTWLSGGEQAKPNQQAKKRLEEKSANKTDKRAAINSREALTEYGLRDIDGFSSPMNLEKGVASVARGDKLGDSFQYSIDHPVNLPRQKSALLPIVGKKVEGTRVSIYNEATHAKFPLLGLKFKNTSGLHLMQGPLTIYENDTYAGDARILDLQPDEERLLSYAVDLGTEVETKPHETNGKLTKVKVNKGILTTTTKVREGKTYTAKNRSTQDRLLIVEHPYRKEFTLVSKEKPSERARDVYRFEIKSPAGKSAAIDIVEERDLEQKVELTNSSDDSIRFFLTSTVPSPKVKDALKKALDLKARADGTKTELAQVNKDLKDITVDQARLRANIKEVPSTAAAYKRYLDKLDKQETEIESFQASIKKLQDAEVAQTKEYETYLAALDVE